MGHGFGLHPSSVACELVIVVYLVEYTGVDRMHENGKRVNASTLHRLSLH